MFRSIAISTITLLTSIALFGQTSNRLAPGAPGRDAHWPSAAKNGFGTSNTIASKVWFTLNNGVMTEVYYPRLDVPNVQTLQLIVVGGKVETESEDMIHRLEVLDPQALTFRQINTARSGYYTITKTYVTDPQRNTVLIQIEVASREANNVYVYYDPSLNNSGMHDSAWTEGDALLAVDGDKASALISSSGFAYPDEWLRDTLKPSDREADLEISNGYLGSSDGLTELKRNWNRSGFTSYRRADNGNVVQVAALKGFQGWSGNLVRHCTLALSFGKTPGEAVLNARASLAKGFTRARREYEAGWHSYLKRLRRVEAKYQRQFDMAAMVLKALEDKTYRGAMVASPSIPWGGGPNANEPTISGYHAVWSRDLYHVATAFLALGDRSSANRALDYLFKVQQKADGSFPQNSWVDGHAIGGGLQMDQVAFPLILAYQLQRTDEATWLQHVKPAADFILRNGPYTGQDRWEEKSGYSPSTIAAEIAGLVCAARIAGINRDKAASDKYLNKADEWVQSLERWTSTSRGPHAQAGYYLRITENDDPNDAAGLEINSGGGLYDEREIVDAGFLELVRLGIKPASDPLIVRSLGIIDRLIKVDTKGGSGWYRYNHDAYGERTDGGNYDGRTGVGRLWTLLTGERGEYDVARGDLAAARKRLDAMMAFANDGMMIPEQVWDRNESPRPELRFGEGTGSATPLAWSMAQFIRLATNISRRQNIETPRIVAARYLQNRKRKNDRSN
ncbi:MAG: glucoamylase [Blastocatellia bacterium]|jgi:glucoamylase|nr:glucoamylase [Blastocatellia bacterium]